MFMKIPFFGKRQRSMLEQVQTSQCSASGESSSPSAKKQKLSQADCTNQNRRPSGFWDSLSKVWLTKRALKEFDRRNDQSAETKRLTRNTDTDRKRAKPLLTDPSNTQYDSELKRFARHGGPNLSNLQGYYPEPADPFNSNICPTASAMSGTKTGGQRYSVYDDNFQQNLIDHGIYPEHHCRTLPPPNNWKEIKERLKRRRPSLDSSSFDEEAFKDFSSADAESFTEADLKASAIPFILGKTKSYMTIARGVVFNNLDSITDHQMPSARPYLFYGAHPEHLNHQVRELLAGHIVPCDERTPRPANFFLEVMDGEKPPILAKRQALYYGALGARGMHTLQSFGADDPMYDGKAYTITATYHDGVLFLYTTHPTKSPDPSRLTDYHIKRLGAFILTNNPESFREGATAYRNARDWAEEQRKRFIEDANRHALTCPPC